MFEIKFKSLFFQSYNAFSNIKELFAEELAFKDPRLDLQAYSHINVDIEHVNDDGEISSEYLKTFGGTKLWTEFTYKCNHCDDDFTGLIAYMDHMRDAGIKSFKVRCVEKTCVREYAALYSYINHSAEHHEHLMFSCIFCKPTRIFYNIVCLTNHYMGSHSDVNFALYACLECGTYYQNITQLRVHKMNTHDKPQEIEQSSDDSEVYVMY